MIRDGEFPNARKPRTRKNYYQRMARSLAAIVVGRRVLSDSFVGSRRILDHDMNTLAPFASVLQADLQLKNIEPGKFRPRPIERDKSRRVDTETLLDIRRFQRAAFHAHRAVPGRNDKPDRRQWASRAV